MARITQKELVLEYLKDHKKITSFTAAWILGIMDLPKRICELQDMGYKFERTWKTKKNRYDVTVKYLEYRLVKED